MDLAPYYHGTEVRVGWYDSSPYRHRCAGTVGTTDNGQANRRGTAKECAAVEKMMSRAKGRMKESSKERAAGKNTGRKKANERKEGRVTRARKESREHEHGKAWEGRKKWQQQKACGER